MERRHEAGESLDVHSVASFFVSRVDTEVDKRLAASSAARTCSASRRSPTRAPPTSASRSCSGRALRALREAGRAGAAPAVGVDRREGPALPRDQVRGLAGGPDTVNTMPMPTLLAVRREGVEVRGATADQDPPADLERLAEAGIDMDDVTKTLLERGHRQVRRPVRQPDRRHRAGARGHRHRAAHDDRVGAPDELEPPIIERVRDGSGENVAGASGHATSRSGAAPACAEIGDRLGWLTITEKMLEHAAELEAFAEAKADGLEHAVLLGMGGSSLGPEVIRRSYGEVPGGCGCTCSTRPTRAPCSPRSERSTSTRRSSSSPRSRRHDRDALAHALLLRAHGRDGSVRGGHRPRAARWRSAASAASGTCSRTTPTSAAATRCCPTSGSCRPPLRGREHRGAAAPGAGGGAELRAVRLAAVELRPVARLRDGRGGPAGPRQAHLVGLRSRSRASASGSSS